MSGLHCWGDLIYIVALASCLFFWLVYEIIMYVIVSLRFVPVVLGLVWYRDVVP